MMKILRTRPINLWHFFTKWFSGFSSFGQLTLGMGVFRRLMGSPDCKDLKKCYGGSYFSRYLIHTSFLWKNALNWSAWFSGFSPFRQLTLDMGVFNRFMGSPILSHDCKDFKNSMEEGNFRGMYLKKPSFGGFWGRGWPLKSLKWTKPLGMGWVWLKRNPSTTNGWILWFSWDWHCTSFKKTCC